MWFMLVAAAALILAAEQGGGSGQKECRRFEGNNCSISLDVGKPGYSFEFNQTVHNSPPGAWTIQQHLTRTHPSTLTWELSMGPATSSYPINGKSVSSDIQIVYEDNCIYQVNIDNANNLYLYWSDQYINIKITNPDGLLNVTVQTLSKVTSRHKCEEKITTSQNVQTTNLKIETISFRNNNISVTEKIYLKSDLKSDPFRFSMLLTQVRTGGIFSGINVSFESAYPNNRELVTVWTDVSDLRVCCQESSTYPAFNCRIVPPICPADQSTSNQSSTSQTQPITTLSSNSQTQPITTLSSTSQTQPITTLSSTSQTQPITTLSSNSQTQPITTLPSTSNTQQNVAAMSVVVGVVIPVVVCAALVILLICHLRQKRVACFRAPSRHSKESTLHTRTVDNVGVTYRSHPDDVTGNNADAEMNTETNQHDRPLSTLSVDATTSYSVIRDVTSQKTASSAFQPMMSLYSRAKTPNSNENKPDLDTSINNSSCPYETPPELPPKRSDYSTLQQRPEGERNDREYDQLDFNLDQNRSTERTGRPSSKRGPGANPSSDLPFKGRASETGAERVVYHTIEGDDGTAVYHILEQAHQRGVKADGGSAKLTPNDSGRENARVYHILEECPSTGGVYHVLEEENPSATHDSQTGGEYHFLEPLSAGREKGILAEDKQVENTDSDCMETRQPSQHSQEERYHILEKSQGQEGGEGNYHILEKSQGQEGGEGNYHILEENAENSYGRANSYAYGDAAPSRKASPVDEEYNSLDLDGNWKGVQGKTDGDEAAVVYSHLHARVNDEDGYNEVDRYRRRKVIDDDYTHLQK